MAKEEVAAIEETRLEKARKEPPPKQFIGSGSTLLDLALGGGWAIGRTFNIVGDKSTGKTLLAIEAFANFKKQYPHGRMRYAEAESAFDDAFAEQLGFPQEVTKPDELLITVEQFRDDLYKFANEDSNPCIYILDSLDALSDDAEQEKWTAHIEGKKEKGSMGAQKAKEMSELFRNINKKLLNCAVGIVSQIRDNVGATWGETKTRSGGRALDFYATHVVWLQDLGKEYRSVKEEQRAVGLKVGSKVKKNKIGFPFREADYSILFGYGIDDEYSMLDWLKSVKEINEKYYKEIDSLLTTSRNKRDFVKLKEIREILVADATRVWKEIDAKLAPPIRKYSEE